jgi:hypothetical protein
MCDVKEVLAQCAAQRLSHLFFRMTPREQFLQWGNRHERRSWPVSPVGRRLAREWVM